LVLGEKEGRRSIVRQLQGRRSTLPACSPPPPSVRHLSSRGHAAASPRCFASRSWTPRSHSDALKSSSWPPSSPSPFSCHRRSPPLHRSCFPSSLAHSSIALAIAFATSLAFVCAWLPNRYRPKSPGAVVFFLGVSSAAVSSLAMGSPLWCISTSTVKLSHFVLIP
jgi:hypothetical protein